MITHHDAICYIPLENSVPLNVNSAGPWLSAGLMWFIAVNQAVNSGENLYQCGGVKVSHPDGGVGTRLE